MKLSYTHDEKTLKNNNRAIYFDWNLIKAFVIVRLSRKFIKHPIYMKYYIVIVNISWWYCDTRESLYCGRIILCNVMQIYL